MNRGLTTNKIVIWYAGEQQWERHALLDEILSITDVEWDDNVVGFQVSVAIVHYRNVSSFINGKKLLFSHQREPYASQTTVVDTPIVLVDEVVSHNEGSLKKLLTNRFEQNEGLTMQFLATGELTWLLNN